MTKMTTTMELIQSLDRGAQEGRLRRKLVVHLKNGFFSCVIYKDQVKHPDPRVYESGKIVMERFATIGEHDHKDDWEEYTVLAGKVISNGVEYGPGETMTCKKGETHSCRNIARGESVLRFVKRR